MSAVFYYLQLKLVPQRSQVGQVERETVKVNRNKKTDRAISFQHVATLVKVDSSEIIHVDKHGNPIADFVNDFR